MNLEDLRSAQTRERATDGLQDLRDSFYADVADYIQELTDRIGTAEQVVEAIYERRMGKLVKQASLAAAGMPDDENGLTAEEQALYGDLVERIEANKAHVLDVVAGDAESSASADAAPEPGPTDTRVDATSGSAADADTSDSSAAAAMGGGLDDADEASADEESADEPGAESVQDADPAPDEEPPAAIAEDLARVKSEDDGPAPDGGVQSETGEAALDADERVRVRVIDDVGEILGVDERPYDLEAEDVVTLPEANAEPLVQKDAVEKLD